MDSTKHSNNNIVGNNMTYYRGTLSEFNTWHDAAKLAYGISSQGIVGYINGVAAPQNQRTIAYVNFTQNPDGSNDYIWPYGAYPDINKTDLSQTDINNLGWFKE